MALMFSEADFVPLNERYSMAKPFATARGDYQTALAVGPTGWTFPLYVQARTLQGTLDAVLARIDCYEESLRRLGLPKAKGRGR